MFLFFQRFPFFSKKIETIKKWNVSIFCCVSIFSTKNENRNRGPKNGLLEALGSCKSGVVSLCSVAAAEAADAPAAMMTVGVEDSLSANGG